MKWHKDHLDDKVQNAPVKQDSNPNKSKQYIVTPWSIGTIQREIGYRGMFTKQEKPYNK